LLSTYTDLKEYVKDNLAEIQESKYPEDYLTEYADGLVPIYYHEILQEWTDLDAEFRDRWHELGEAGADASIYSLMAIDLYMYYDQQLSSAYWELTNTEETN
jgi:hypothetical protein